MSELANAVAGFSQSGGMASIVKLATMGLNVAGQFQEDRAKAEEVEAAGAQELRRSKAEAEKLKREKRKTASRQRALFAKSGVDISSGSPLAVMAETAGEYNQDIALALSEGTAAYNLAHKQAKNIKKSTWFKAGPTILSGLEEFSRSPLVSRKAG